MSFQRYSPDQVKISFSGITVTGFQDGTFVEVERSEDQYTTHVGSLGDVTRTRNLNKTGKITVTLMQHAPINDLLSITLAADALGDTPARSIMVKDLTNGMLCHASNAWIEKTPKIERGKESAGIQWVFACADLEVVPSNTALAI